MTKLPLVTLAALCALSTAAFAESTSQRGALVVERCHASRRSSGDSCRPERNAGAGSSCQVTVTKSGGRPSEVSVSTGLWTKSSPVDRPFLYDGGRAALSYGMSSFSGRRDRGTATLSGDQNGPRAAQKVVIYDNLDDSGSEYIRYTCRNLGANVRREAAAEEQAAPFQSASLNEDGARSADETSVAI